MHIYAAGLLTVVLLLTTSGSGVRGEETAQAPGASKRAVTFEPFDFRAAAEASPAAKGHYFRPVAFSPESPPRVAALYQLGSDTLGVALAGSRGGNVRLLGGHDGPIIYEIQWAPDSSALLYPAWPYRYGPKPPSETCQIWVLSTGRQPRRDLVAEGARHPQWERDANEIFFWRQEGSVKESPTGHAFGPWRLYRATGPWTKPTVVPAAPTLLTKPMDVSPGGRLLAYWANDRAEAKGDDPGVVVRDLDAGTETTFPLPEADLLSRSEMRHGIFGEAVRWSGDGLWALLEIRGPLGETREHRLLRMPEGRFVDLTTLVRQWLIGNAREFSGYGFSVWMEAPAWLGRLGHRLLIYGVVPIYRRKTDAAPDDPGEKAWKWVVYDADGNAFAPVSGLGPVLYGVGVPPLVSPDGQHAWVAMSRYFHVK